MWERRKLTSTTYFHPKLLILFNIEMTFYALNTFFLFLFKNTFSSFTMTSGTLVIKIYMKNFAK